MTRLASGLVVAANGLMGFWLVAVIGMHTQPDALEYARGIGARWWWSSAWSSALGSVGGYRLLQVESGLAIAALGAVLVRRAGPLLAAAVLFSPAGLAGLAVGADPAGALAVALAYRRPRWLPVVFFVHVEAGLVLAVVEVVEVARRRCVPALWARALPAVAAVVAAAGACVAMWHVQFRYFLPAFAIAAIAAVSRRAPVVVGAAPAGLATGAA